MRIVRPHPLPGNLGPIRLRNAAPGQETALAEGSRPYPCRPVDAGGRRGSRPLLQGLLRRRVLRQQRRLPPTAHTRPLRHGEFARKSHPPI